MTRRKVWEGFMNAWQQNPNKENENKVIKTNALSKKSKVNYINRESPNSHGMAVMDVFKNFQESLS